MFHQIIIDWEGWGDSPFPCATALLEAALGGGIFRQWHPGRQRDYEGKEISPITKNISTIPQPRMSVVSLKGGIFSGRKMEFWMIWKYSALTRSETKEATNVYFFWIKSYICIWGVVIFFLRFRYRGIFSVSLINKSD